MDLLFDLLPIFAIRATTDLSMIEELFLSIPEMYSTAQRKVIVEKLLTYIKDAVTRKDYKLASVAINVRSILNIVPHCSLYNSCAAFHATNLQEGLHRDRGHRHHH